MNRYGTYQIFKLKSPRASNVFSCKMYIAILENFTVNEAKNLTGNAVEEYSRVIVGIFPMK